MATIVKQKTGAQQQRKLRCYICDSPNHLACQCPQGKTESSGRKLTQTKSSKYSGTRVIRTGSHMCTSKSGTRCVEVMIEGVPATGLIDTGSDITIIRDLFYQIVTEAHLKVQSLKAAEQKACSYDQKPITLDGQMDMRIKFGEKVVSTTVYVKLVAPDQLLLSETVCHLLGIVSYHPNVQFVERCSLVEETISGVSASCTSTTEVDKGLDCGSTTKEGQPAHDIEKENCPVFSNDSSSNSENIPPMKESAQSSTKEQQLPTLARKPVGSTASPAQVRLVSTVRLPAYHSAIVPVQVEELRGSVLIEPECPLDDCLQVDESLVKMA